MSKNVHIGSSFDDFLAEEGLLEEATSVATKRVIAWQVAEAMKAGNIKKSALAAKMKTSRTLVDRMLDETDTGLTLETLSKAATALGYEVKVALVPASKKAKRIIKRPASLREKPAKRELRIAAARA